MVSKNILLFFFLPLSIGPTPVVPSRHFERHTESTSDYDQVPSPLPVSEVDILSQQLENVLECSEKKEDNRGFRTSSPKNFTSIADSDTESAPVHHRSFSDDATHYSEKFCESSDMSPRLIYTLSKTLPLPKKKNSKKGFDHSVNSIDETKSSRRSSLHSNTLEQTFSKVKSLRKKSLSSWMKQKIIKSDEGLNNFRIDRRLPFEYEVSPIYSKACFSDPLVATENKENTFKPKSLPDLHRVLKTQPNKPLPHIEFNNRNKLKRRPAPQAPTGPPRIKKSVYQNVPLTSEQLETYCPRTKCYENVCGDVVEWLNKCGESDDSRFFDKDITKILSSGSAISRTPSDSGKIINYLLFVYFVIFIIYE